MNIRGQHGFSIDLERLDTDLRGLKDASLNMNSDDKTDSGTGFGQLLSKGLADVNDSLKQSERSSMDLASGKTNNIHEVMLSATRAELSFQMLVQLRNKAVEAYQEVARMQV